MNKHHYVAIMAGGIGSRFWPMSRTNFPKQFLDILNTGKTLIQSTFDRFATFIPAENIFVITSNEYVNIVKKQLPEIPLQNILGEPSRKNTAPCIAYISFKLNQIDPKASLIVAPADHIILDPTAFTKVSLEALAFVNKHNAFITLGIKPTYANTGYGYIQYEQHGVTDNVYKVKTFTEKPNLELAKTFIASGEFLWNAGIFVWQVNSAYENLGKDYLGNAVAGENVIVIDATKCVVHAPHNKLVMLQGLDDYIVVDTEDVLLICKKEKEQEIKEYVAEVKRNKGDKFL
ncbi:MAG: mannose-1-phosphate guanylyltransferase [Chitinophagaceae bacterium]|nr:MAG: mannose-1-phosphate guanylyltransferase [Chitinophagaceae bacterium]